MMPPVLEIFQRSKTSPVLIGVHPDEILTPCVAVDNRSFVCCDMMVQRITHPHGLIVNLDFKSLNVGFHNIPF
jgi:hypothetical protein